MRKKQHINELQQNKNECMSSLESIEISVGHHICVKKDKSLEKKVLKTYDNFNQEIEAFHKMQETILSLDSERNELKESIEAKKAIRVDLQKDIQLMYEQIGQALYENYNPSIADVFGKEYTELSVIEHKKEDALLQEESLSETSSSAGFFSRIISHVKTGAIKTHVSTIENKRKSLLVQGAKSTIETGRLSELLGSKKLSDDIEVLYNAFENNQKALHDTELAIDSLSINEKAIKTSLEKMGVSFTVQRRISIIDKQIEEKHSEQDSFCATVGHDYVARYVSPDGDAIADFPKDLEGFLQSIQEHRYTIASLSRKIEIEHKRNEIEAILVDNDALQVKIEDNTKKIEALRLENENMEAIIKEKNKEKSELEKKLTELMKEEEKASKK